MVIGNGLKHQCVTKNYISEFLPLRSSLLTVAGVVVALGGLGEPMVGFQLFHLPYETILGRKL